MCGAEVAAPHSSCPQATAPPAPSRGAGTGPGGWRRQQQAGPSWQLEGRQGPQTQKAVPPWRAWAAAVTLAQRSLPTDYLILRVKGVPDTECPWIRVRPWERRDPYPGTLLQLFLPSGSQKPAKPEQHSGVGEGAEPQRQAGECQCTLLNSLAFSWVSVNCAGRGSGGWGWGSGGRATMLWSLLWTIQDLVLAMSSYRQPLCCVKS